jgi:glycosyltransferase involved in cell wall biosynthesis
METKPAVSEKQRLFFIIPSLMRGGAERVLISLANYFNQLNFETFIVSLNTNIPAYPIDDGVKVIYILKRDKNFPGHRIFYVLQTFYKLIKLLLEHKPVFVVSFITSANIWAGITCNITGTPYLVSERTSPNRTVNQFGYFHKRLAALIYKKAAAVVVSAKGVEDCLLQNGAFKNLDNIYRITNAVPLFKPVSAEKVHRRKFILGVGRLAYVKGFDMLIAAYAKAQPDDIDLLIIGEGEERANLICQVYNMGLREKVILPGSKTNLQDYYSQAEMFVLPSRNEGYPNALVEAMSFGCPCVAMNCDFGPSEIITNWHNGVLIPRNSITAMADAIGRIITDPELKAELGNHALNINDTNNADRILKDWENLILKQVYKSSKIGKKTNGILTHPKDALVIKP